LDLHRVSGRHLLSIVALCLASVLPASGQIFHMATYNDQDGLPSAAVTGMVQDADGCIWLATRLGLVRYDGRSWITEDGEEPLTGAPIGDIALDQHGDIWAVSQRIPILVHHRREGSWHTRKVASVATQEWFAHTLLPGPDHGDQTMLAVLSTDGHVDLIVGDRATRLTGDRRFSWASSGLWRDRELWLTTSEGLQRITGLPDDPRIEPVAGAPREPIYGLATDAAGKLLLVGRNWIGRLEADGIHERRDIRRLAIASPYSGITVTRDRSGGLYVAAIDQLFYVPADEDEVTEMTTRNGLAGDGATAILIDRAGPVWFASLRGLSKLIDRGFVGYDRRQGLLDDEVSSVLHTRNGRVLLGHAGGITILAPDRRHIRFESTYGRAARVSDLLEAPDGTIWIAASRQGLGRLEDDDTVTWLNDEYRLEESIYALAHDGEGTLYIGGTDGLWRSRDDRIEAVDFSATIGNGYPLVRRLTLSRDGSLWIATGTRGVIQLHADGLHRFPGANAALGSTYGVLERPDGRHWVATAAGLAVLEDGLVVPTIAPDPVVKRPIYALTGQADGIVWIGTDVGVWRWDGQSLVSYTARDGLVGSETNRDALQVDGRGRLWIGTDRGVSIHDARLLPRERFAPPVRIVGIEVAGQAVPLQEPVAMITGGGDLDFHFVSAPFIDERQLRFRTYLEGLDADWREPAANAARVVHYSHLPPGEYRLHVQAVDGHGVQGRPVSSPAIRVRPPFWRRGWFVGAVILVGIGLVALVVMILQSRRYTRQLSREVAERTRELAASEAVLRRESNRLATVMASISDGVLALGRDDRVVMGNRAVCDLVGQPLAEVLGQPLDGLFPGLSCEPGLDAAVASGAVVAYRQPVPSGETLDLEVSAAPLGGTDDEPVGRVLVFRDISDRLRLEQESIRAQKLESLGVLAGGLAHDFNNLLTVVLGHISVIEENRLLSPDDRLSLDRMRGATEQARSLTGQLLTFARGGAPRKQLADVGAIARRAAGLSLTGSAARVELDLPDGLAHAEVDPGQIEQVFSNLLINARQAMPDGGRVWVTGSDGTEDGERWLEFVVRDEGPGIAPELLDRVFEPYFSTKEQGTGLGLSICYSIVKRHDGELTVHRPTAGGAEFRVRLRASAQRCGVPDAPPTAPPSEGLRILVLDDEEAVRDILTRMLTRQGHVVDGVAGGEEAVTAYRKALDAGRRYDLLVVDLTIAGGLGGRETMARILALDPTARAIVASGYSNDPVMSDHARHGFAAALGKPFDRVSLARAIEAVMDVEPASSGQ
jgi:PAS domain S-box-containing protein